MLKEIDIEIEGKKFVIGKFPAKQGLYIMARLPSSMVAVIENFPVYKEVMDEVLTFAGIRGPDGRVVRFETDALFDNHVEDWAIATRLIEAIMEHNRAFLAHGAK